MSKEEKKELIVLGVRVLVSLGLALLGFFYLNEAYFPFYVNLITMGAAWLIISYDILIKGFKEAFFEKNPFNEYVLMSVASIGSFCLRLFGPSHNEYLEGVLVMLLYQVGEFFTDLSQKKAQKSITDAIDLRNQKAMVYQKDGSIVYKTPEELKIGDVYLLKKGGKVLCDSVLLEGKGSFDQSSLTGEFLPVDKKEGDDLVSGSICLGSSLKAKVVKLYEDSEIHKLLDLVENSAKKKSKSTRFISRFAKVYTPIVMALAVGIAIIPPLVLGMGDSSIWSRWIYTSLCFLVIACPCAVVISIPLTYLSGLALASKNAVVVKGASYFDKLNRLDYVAFDKTGTLTTGQMNVNLIKPNGIGEDEFMEYLLAAESRSDHPLGKAITKGHDLSKIDKGISRYEEIAGFGIHCTYKGHSLLAGKADLLNPASIKDDLSQIPGTIIYLAVDNQYRGYVVLNDVLRGNSKQLIEKLHEKGLKTMLLSGDKENNVKALSEELGIDEWHAELEPGEKVEYIHEKIDEGKGCLAYIGDGVNDAPSIVLADVGVAMGGLGSDASISNADVILMNDDPSAFLKLLQISKKTEARANVNLYVALGIKLAVMLVSVFWSSFPLWAAVLADTGLTVLLVINALLLSFKKIR